MLFYINATPQTPGQNDCLFTDDIFKCIFKNEICCILIQISLEFVPKRPIDRGGKPNYEESTGNI